MADRRHADGYRCVAQTEYKHDQQLAGGLAKEKEPWAASKNTGGIMIKEWLDGYKPKNTLEAEQALREIMQDIALAGLQRSGFFEKAAFYGGTALRIFHWLPRFSEDLDFSLLAADPDFALQPYLDGMREQFSALGMQVSINQKEKTNKINFDSAFLKTNTAWKELVLQGIAPQEKTGFRPDIRIKIEVDTEPPLGFATEEKLLLRPFSFYVKCFSLPD